MDVPQMMFQTMLRRRHERIEAKRAHGVLEFKPYRNPLAAQKTPRKDYLHNFDFSVPEGPKDLKNWDRWQYPNSDFGLMGKFQSQREIYQKYMQKDEEYQRAIAAMAEQAKQLDLQHQQEKLQMEQKPSARDNFPPTSARLHDNNNKNNDNPPLGSARSSMTISSIGGGSGGEDPATHTSRGRSVNKASDDVSVLPLLEQKISGMKNLGARHPEVLAKWRAQRAAEFVVTQKHPLEPPTERELLERPFLPCGTTVGNFGSKSSSGALQMTKPKKSNPSRNVNTMMMMSGGAEVNTGRMRESLGALMAELDKTENAIARTELKLALKNKSRGNSVGNLTVKVPSLSSINLLNSP